LLNLIGRVAYRPDLVARLRREAWLLGALTAGMASVWAFFGIADEVFEGEAHAFDRAVMLLMRDPADPSLPWGPPWFPEMVRDATALGSMFVITLVTLVTIGFLWMSGKRGGALLVALSVAGGAGLSTLLKDVFERPRPDLVPHGMEVFTASFPSGHSVLAAVTYLTLGALLMRLELRRRVKAYVMAVAILITAAVGLSRVYLGVHWPTDVLAGWTVGAGWALLCWGVAVRLQERGAVEKEGETQEP